MLKESVVVGSVREQVQLTMMVTVAPALTWVLVFIFESPVYA